MDQLKLDTDRTLKNAGDPPDGFKMTEIGELPAKWTVAALKKAVKREKHTVNPQQHPDEEFTYYSIPAYQEKALPITERGSRIRSQKLIVPTGSTLFGKLNPRVPKIWRVQPSKLRKIASAEFIQLDPDPEQVDGSFLFYLCQSGFVLPRSQKLVSGSTPSRQRVDVKAFLDLRIPLPPLPEQRAIARLLRAVQEAIWATERVIEVAKELKRSMMEYLFTYGPVPVDQADQVDVAESGIGRGPIAWRIARLGDVARTASGGTPNRKRPEYYGGRVPWVKSGELNDGPVGSTEEAITELGLRESSAKIFSSGTLLVAMYGATAGKVGMLIGPAATNQAVCAVFPGEQASPTYLFHAIMRRRFALLEERYGGAQPNISQQVLRAFKLPLPELQTQLEVVHLLEAVDVKLRHELRQKDAIQATFASLLHNLMMGKIRVTPTEQDMEASE